MRRMLLGLCMAAAWVSPATAGRPAAAAPVDASDHLVVEVKGLVCQACADGTRKNVERLRFVDHRGPTNGVQMNTEDGTITVTVKPGEPRDFDRLVKGIFRGGYDPVAIRIAVTGTVRSDAGTYRLREDGTGADFALTSPQGKAWDGGSYEGKLVRIEGRIPVREGARRVDPVLEVSRVVTASAAP